MLIVAHSLLYFSYLVYFSTLLLPKLYIYIYNIIHFYLSVRGCEKDPLGALKKLFKSLVFVSPLFVYLSHTHTVNHTWLSLLCPFVSFTYPFFLFSTPFGPINLPFAHFYVCHISLLSCCSFIFIPLLLSFYSVFFLSLILSFPSLTWTLIINVSVRKRGKMCEIRDCLFFFFCSRLECVLVWPGLTQSVWHTHTHTHTPTDQTFTLAHSFYNLIVLHWCFKQLGTIVASTEREKWRGARTDHPVHPGHKTHSELLSHSLLVNFECEQFTVSVSEPLSLYRALFVW